MNNRSQSLLAPLFILVGILVAKLIAMILVILYAGIGLGPDEAQYWTWSQDLSLGYYSKPPGIAWAIKIGTTFLGNTELGVRLPALFFGFCLPIATFYFAIYCGLKPFTALWSGIIMALTPMGFLASFFSTTDSPFVLFWILGLAVLADAIKNEETPNYLLFGLTIALGALFKWPIYILWIVMLAYFFWQRPKVIKPFSLLLGILISLLGLLPSLYWNSQHDWPTFKHVFSTIKGGNSSEVAQRHFFNGNFFDFLGAQAALLSPIIFILLIVAIVTMVKQRKYLPNSLFFCSLVSLLILAGYMLVSIFQKMQGNWAVYVYPVLIVLIAWAFVERTVHGRAWLVLGIITSLISTAFALSIPYIQSHKIAKNYQIPYKWNPFRHNIGWQALHRALEEAEYDPKEHFLVADRYQMASILSFYSPKQKRAYFLNLDGIRKNQFSYWPGLAEKEVGKSGFFVWVENNPKFEQSAWQQMEHYQLILSQYFNKVQWVSMKPLFFSYDSLAKGVLIFKCEEYNGNVPHESKIY